MKSYWIEGDVELVWKEIKECIERQLGIHVEKARR